MRKACACVDWGHVRGTEEREDLGTWEDTRGRWRMREPGLRCSDTCAGGRRLPEPQPGLPLAQSLNADAAGRGETRTQGQFRRASTALGLLIWCLPEPITFNGRALVEHWQLTTFPLFKILNSVKFQVIVKVFKSSHWQWNS